MAADEDSDKTEQPTPYRLEQARKKGSVAKSAEFNAWVGLCASCLALTTLGATMVNEVLAICGFLFSRAAILPLDANGADQWLAAGAADALGVIAPLLGVLAIAAVVVNLGQAGFLLAPSVLAPDVSRLNPVEGFKKLFSRKALFDLVKSCIKVSGAAVIFWVMFRAHASDLVVLAASNPAVVQQELLSLSWRLACWLLAFLFLLALLDLLFSRRQYMQKLRMTKRDIRDEYKNREGDPAIKAKRRSLQNELRKRSESFANLGKADVLITNPVSLGVLIQYDSNAMAVPRVIGKVQGMRCNVLKRRALAAGVMIVENKALARKIFRSTGMYESIPVDSYFEVAGILREAFRRRGKSLF